MAIITISRGSFSKGKEVAERVAAHLDYRSVSREVILEASEDFHIPLNRLDHAIHDAPSILQRFTYEKQKYIAYVASEILTRFERDNVVYHGLAGHFFARNLPHLLKVRIIADMEDRIVALMEKDGLERDQAAAFLEKDDRDRKAWSYQLYGVDTTDCKLYDLVIHIGKLTIDDAVGLICTAAVRPQFRATAESQQMIENLALAARTRAALIEEYPTCEVTSDAGTVAITVRASQHTDTGLAASIEEKALKIPGVSAAVVRLRPAGFFS
ncbi:MAG: cytidylate kinase-like family protein [Desulfocapsaceae bacterium]|nr:cytidylate kinase-like family protein [Desulfocapsaceae bacterium]